VSFAAITLYVASQRVFIVVSVCFVIDSVQKVLDTPSYVGDSDEASLQHRNSSHCFTSKIFLLSHVSGTGMWVGKWF
jgi:hypothetical protein